MVARTDREISQQVFDFTVPEDEQDYPSLALQFLLPSEEGVYDLVLTALHSEDGFSRANPFRGQGQIVAQRKVQFVVLEEKS